jgi:hypothetical protein
MIRLTTIILFLFVLTISGNLHAQNLSAKEIVKKADDKSRGQSSQGEMTMTIIRPTWTRSITMKSWGKGTQYALILITSPAKDKGQVFLKIKTDMWNWVPSIDKMIKIPPSMMMQSWMGSDFTNDDLVRESSVVSDYDHKMLGQENVRDQQCYKIEMIPHPDAPVTWGKVIVWITTKGFDTWKAEYYDEDMKLINTMNASNIKKMGDREIPVRLEITPKENANNRTVMETKSLVFDKPISDSFFSQQNMRKLSQSTR